MGSLPTRKKMVGMKWNKKWILPLTAVGLVLAALLAWWIIVVDNIADEVVIEAGGMPSASDFLLRDLDIPAEFDTDLTEYDLTVPGAYVVRLRYNGRLYEATLRVRDTVSPVAVTQDLTVFATQRPEAEDFIAEIRDMTHVTVAYKTEPDMAQEGQQPIVLLLTDEGGNVTEAEAVLTVIHDDTAPVIHGVQEIRWYIGYALDYLKNVTVTDDLDPDVHLTVDDGAVDLTSPGTYELIYSAEDICGNRTEIVTTITVLEDTRAPEILGANDRSLCVGSTIAYRSGILVRDDVDGTPTLTIDSSQVDLSRPGSYPLVYHAVDDAGNESTREITVTVYKKVSYFVEESVIYAEADRILSEIITEDMSVQQQVEAVYNWTRKSFWYNSYADKKEWKQSAYQMIRSGYGDCFSFFSVSKLMFERLGIPNIDVRRMWTYSHSSDHFWNMVSLDGGNTYYYYDSTPFPGSSARFCLVTDADLDAFSAIYGNYFSRDRSVLPTTPLERP